MTVTTVPFEDEDEEFSEAYAIILRKKGVFVNNNIKDPPFYISFNSHEERDAARR